MSSRKKDGVVVRVITTSLHGKYLQRLDKIAADEQVLNATAVRMLLKEAIDKRFEDKEDKPKKHPFFS